MKETNSFAVIGAAGYTGRFVVAELHRRKIGVIEVTRENASLDRADSIDRAIAGADAIVNCAGPFLDTAEPVIEAALRAGIHYLDVTAEQMSALSTFERFDAGARTKGIVILPACGFYGTLGELLTAAALGDWGVADEALIYIALDRWWPTKGTRRTGERNTHQRLVLRGRSLVPFESSSEAVTRRFAQPFGSQKMLEVPLSEAVLVSRHLPIQNLYTYLNERPLQDIRNPETEAPRPADELGRSSQIFLMEAVVRNGSNERRAVVKGRDIYAISASMLVEAAQRIVMGSISGGCFTAAQIFPVDAFLEALPLEFVE